MKKDTAATLKLIPSISRNLGRKASRRTTETKKVNYSLQYGGDVGAAVSEMKAWVNVL